MSAKPLFIVLIGPGGVGKGTIARELTARDPHLWLSRSWTTREKRPSEDGSEYFFVTRDAFEKGIAEGKFLEWAEFNGNLYGTPVPEVLNEKDVVLEIEIQGALQVAGDFPAAVIIQIQPPDVETLTERLRNRGDSEAHVSQRLSTTPWETAKGSEIAHYQVINDDLERATDEIISILEELRVARNAAN